MEIIIENSIHDAIARKLTANGKMSRNTSAEGIINNIRKKIIRKQSTNTPLYGQMSILLDDLIKQSRADAAAYEAFLRNAEALVRRLTEKEPDAEVPAALHGRPEATTLFNNLSSIPGLTFKCPADADAKAELA